MCNVNILRRMIENMKQTVYLIPYMKLFKANRTFTAISWDSLQPKLWKFLDESFHSFPLHKSRPFLRILCQQLLITIKQTTAS